MGERIIPVKSNMVLVEKQYAEARPDQHLRETVKNSLEVGATEIYVGTDFVHAEKTAAAGEPQFLLEVSDNGCGMTDEHQKAYMQQLGVSSKPTGPTGNYGFGVRTSSLPGNPVGLDCQSKHASEDVAGLVRLKLGKNGEYCFHTWEYPEKDEEEELVAVPPEYDNLGEQGTRFIFRGDGRSDTVLGFPGHPQRPGYGALNYLNFRFWEFPKGTTVKVQVFPKDRSKWPVTASDPTRRMRHAEGFKHYMEKLSSKCDSFTVGDTRFYWATFEEVRQVYSVPEIGKMNGQVAVLFQSELFFESNPTHLLKEMGIHLQEARQRMVVIVEPLNGADHIQMSYARSHLIVQDPKKSDAKPTDLPWAKWTSEFANHTPDEIALLLAKLGGEMTPAEKAINKSAVKDRLRFLQERVTAKSGLPSSDMDPLDPEDAEGLPGSKPGGFGGQPKDDTEGTAKKSNADGQEEEKEEEEEEESDADGQEEEKGSKKKAGVSANPLASTGIKGGYGSAHDNDPTSLSDEGVRAKRKPTGLKPRIIWNDHEESNRPVEFYAGSGKIQLYRNNRFFHQLFSWWKNKHYKNDPTHQSWRPGVRPVYLTFVEEKMRHAAGEIALTAVVAAAMRKRKMGWTDDDITKAHSPEALYAALAGSIVYRMEQSIHRKWRAPVQAAEAAEDAEDA